MYTIPFEGVDILETIPEETNVVEEILPTVNQKKENAQEVFFVSRSNVLH